MRLDWAHIEPLLSPGTKRLETSKSFARWAAIPSEDEMALDEEENVVESGLVAGEDEEVGEQVQPHLDL